MADGATHGGARPGAGRKRATADAPAFAAQGKGQRTLEGLAGFELGRRSSSTQPPDDDFGASDSPGADASESASVDAAGAAAAAGAATAGAAATSPGQLAMVAGQGSPAPESLAPESDAAAAVEQTPDSAQAASSAASTANRVQSHGAATNTAVRATMPRRLILS